ncbi:hypothetical protein AF332_24520 [Sporosarcina globispora]|uniref:Uncharacterized protein n=1 Tax=Sporosarcina globispora TaxID=1459 RepID=A0A0M0GJJ9_SPOGL|nr:hypothetical protein [Sporosarcina globispora]KON89672.1 hypothetical protein AF332_24520 [Sporosarcina globispora]
MTDEKQMTAEEMIKFIKNMENGQRIKFLDYLFHAHFDSRSRGDMSLATRYYIEDYLDRTLTEEEIEIMKLAYDNGYFVGGKDGMEKVLKGEDEDE